MNSSALRRRKASLYIEENGSRCICVMIKPLKLPYTHMIDAGTKKYL